MKITTITFNLIITYLFTLAGFISSLSTTLVFQFTEYPFITNPFITYSTLGAFLASLLVAPLIRISIKEKAIGRVLLLSLVVLVAATAIFVPFIANIEPLFAGDYFISILMTLIFSSWATIPSSLIAGAFSYKILNKLNAVKSITITAYNAHTEFSHNSSRNTLRV